MNYKFNEEHNLWWKFNEEEVKWKVSEFEDELKGWLIISNAYKNSLNDVFTKIKKEMLEYAK